MTFRFKSIKGNVFTAPPRYAFAVLVPADKNMVYDSASIFYGAFPEMSAKFANTAFVVGKCYGFTRLAPERRSVLNVVVKPNYSSAPRYNDIAAALESLRNTMVAHRIQYVAFVRDNLLFGGCDWERLWYIIYGVFCNTDIAVVVFSEPSVPKI